MVLRSAGQPGFAVLTMYVLVQPMLAKLAGHSAWQAPESIPAITRSPFKKAPGRTDFQRGIYRIENGQFVVESTCEPKLWRVPPNELG